MVVRIRLNYGQAARQTAAVNRQATLVAASLMTPVAVMAWVLAAWRVLADLKVAGAFAISNGLFSHWQVWIAIAILVQGAAFLLQRSARRGDADGEAS